MSFELVVFFNWDCEEEKVNYRRKSHMTRGGASVSLWLADHSAHLSCAQLFLAGWFMNDHPVGQLDFLLTSQTTNKNKHNIMTCNKLHKNAYSSVFIIISCSFPSSAWCCLLLHELFLISMNMRTLCTTLKGW